MSLSQIPMIPLALAGLLAAAAPAAAHAMLERADPPVGSTVAASPAEIRLLFDHDLQPGASQIEVRNAAGEAAAAGPAEPDAANPRLLRLPLRESLPPGAYRVVWRAVSTDQHTTTSRFSFRIGP